MIENKHTLELTLDSEDRCYDSKSGINCSVHYNVDTALYLY